MKGVKITWRWGHECSGFRNSKW